MVPLVFAMAAFWDAVITFFVRQSAYFAEAVGRRWRFHVALVLAGVVAALHFLLNLDTVAFAADLVPMLIAIVGIILSFRPPSKESQVVTMLVLSVAGLAGTGVLTWNRIRGEQVHKDEIRRNEDKIGKLEMKIDGTTSKVVAVNTQNVAILGMLLKLRPERGVTTSKETEQQRRAAILNALRNEYIMSHDSISAQMLAGLEMPPAEWLNLRLKQLGEKWTVQDVNRGLSVLPPRQLSADQQRAVSDALAGLPQDLRITVKTLDGNREAYDYAQQFQQILLKSNRAGNPVVVLGAFWRPTPVGLHLVSHSEDDSAVLYRNRLAGMMAANGIQAEANYGEWVPPGQLYIVVGTQQ